MKNWKTSVAAMIAATATTLLAGHAAQAQVEFAASGSSALFGTLKTAAQSVIPGGSTNNIQVSNGAQVIDTLAAPETGNIWIVWSTSSSPRRIAFDISVDSTVGDRAFFRSDHAHLIGSFPGVPSDVLTAVEGAVFNAAATDIRPEDALVATARSYSFGYSSSNPIRDGGGQAAYPVVFSLGARSFTTDSIGASPILVFVNTGTTTGANPNVLSSVTNVNRFTLGKILDGTLFRTSDLDPAATAPSTTPLTTFIREPLSGTYNTMEFCIPNSKEVGSTQEAAVASNPLNEAGVPLNTASGSQDQVTDGGASSVGGRVRAIGTGALIRGVNSCSNALGYAFYSQSAFSSSAAGNTKYLSVENAEPLGTTYAGGAYPSTPATFPNLVDGAYPIWSILRLVGDPSNTTLGSYVLAARQAGGGGNFAPVASLQVFRSHRNILVNQSTVDGPLTGSATASNGVGAEPAEAGGDAGGGIFLINNETDFRNDTGGQLGQARQ